MINLICSILLTISNPVNADWAKITETDVAVHYVDKSSIRKIGKLRLVWELQNLKFKKRPPMWWQEQSIFEILWHRPIEKIFGPSEKNMSYRYRSEYDCKNFTWRISFYSSHSGPMASGEILKQIEPDYDWSYVSPNTPAMNILRKVCYSRK